MFAQENKGSASLSLSGLTVVILNWNGLQDTLQCLASLASDVEAGLQVLVVDNGSGAPEADAIRTAFPGVSVIATGENLGWAGGNNVGVRWALERGASHVLLLNNDTEVLPGAMCAVLRAAREIGPCLLHPSIYYFDEPSIAQLDPVANLPSASRDEPVLLDHAFGAALLIDRIIFERVGLLDERFFLQLEETDYYRRAVKAGFAAYVIPAARVLHKESRSFGGRRVALKTYYITRNSLLLSAKHEATWSGRLKAMRKLFWTLCNTAGHDIRQDGAAAGKWEMVRWLLWSASPFAHAARAALIHHVLRRYGRAQDTLTVRLARP
ncbi:glycosyltransferase family 2 protein [Aquabacterium lacunae]|uniref:glycosyltransferase family 2 protein n=1 Tax=Aquabacterium lacunae TaxID=2528630 RepID=UPI0013EF49E3|nr:glycosyltransferase family 2 protein [Aquabacterium lacunae]